MNKSHYELTFIVDGNIPETENNRITDEIQDSIKANGAEVNYCQCLGRKKLSYEIKKSQRGTYFVIEFDGEANIIKLLEKDLKLNKNLLRYFIVKKPRNIAQIKPENVKDQTELKSENTKREQKTHKEKTEKRLAEKVKEEEKEEKKEEETKTDEEKIEEAKEEIKEEIKETIEEGVNEKTEEEAEKKDDLDKKLDELLNKDEF